MGLISRVSSRTYRKRTKKNKHPTNMAVGKNKRLTKGSKKGGKKKVVDPFAKKDWYAIKAPAVFKVRNVGHTLVTRTIGNKIAADGLKGRVYDCNQADLNDDGQGHRKFKLVCEDVQGKNCVLNFHGMSLTRDKMCGMVKKMANHDQMRRRRQNHRQLPPPSVRRRFHQKTVQRTNQKDHLRPVPTGQTDPKEDDRNRLQTGLQLRRPRVDQETLARQHCQRYHQSRYANLPSRELLRF